MNTLSAVSIQATGLPILIAWGSVALGGALAWAPWLGPKAIAPLRMVAFLSVTIVVVFHLLPSAWAEIGALALAGLILGLLAPTFLQRAMQSILLRREHPMFAEHCDTLAVRIGYAGLLVHGLADGAALWVIQQQQGEHLDAMLALAAHNIPISAMVAMQFWQTRGLQASIWRTLGLAIACSIGVLLADTTLGNVFPSIEPWAASMVSGLLLHVVTHQLQDAWPLLRGKGHDGPGHHHD
jgi:hypothetical protein